MFISQFGLLVEEHERKETQSKLYGSAWYL